MQRRYHMIVSPAGALALASLTHASQIWIDQMRIDPLGVAVSVGGGLAAAMLPDIDIRMRWLMKHRTWTHSLLAVGVVAAGLGGVGWWVGRWMYEGLMPTVWLYLFSFLYSYVFHLAADMMTVSGVPLFYPWRKKSFHLIPRWSRVSTGSSFHEGPVAVLFSLLAIGLAVGIRYSFVSVTAMLA